MKDLVIHERYRIDRKISHGDSSLVYEGVDMEGNEEVAIKLSAFLDKRFHLLKNEELVHGKLAGGLGIPHMRWAGPSCEYAAIVLDLLGPSLEDLFNYCGRKFSIKTILLIADQALSRIEYMHSKRYIHCDIKPENFLMGLGQQGNVIHIIDFGLSKEFLDAEHEKTPIAGDFRGTNLFASINTHSGYEQSRRDDLECLGYMLLYLANGSLPWENMDAPDNGQLSEQIKEKKMALSAETLCHGLPKEFVTYFEYVRALEYSSVPAYEYLRSLFQCLFEREGFKRDDVFDWTEKLFHEMKGNA